MLRLVLVRSCHTAAKTIQYGRNDAGNTGQRQSQQAQFNRSTANTGYDHPTTLQFADPTQNCN